MDFTREPIIETIVTPKEGYKLVVRSSKGSAQEEYFVDSVEVVSFSHALFFRSMERPKSFLVPVADYEILEVREARMVLKNAGLDRSIKIGGGREGNLKATNREFDKNEGAIEEEIIAEQEDTNIQVSENPEIRQEVKVDKKRDRRRHYRKRRGGKGEEREENAKEAINDLSPSDIPSLEDEKINLLPPAEEVIENGQTSTLSPGLLSSLLQPPPTLISETINRYRENALFKNAFFLTEEEQYKPHDKVQELLNEDDDVDFAPYLQEPTFANEPESSNSETTEQLMGDKTELFENIIERELKREAQTQEQIFKEIPSENITSNEIALTNESNLAEYSGELSFPAYKKEFENEGEVFSEESQKREENEKMVPSENKTDA
ncbi:hypothetical protein [Candidatus Protochlamydia amoebophila]|uniref:hypothetical protein n=1 Tax=Candidatus Protochlamydia amoebophila TaxID=362787 RepID=UPI001BC9A7AC|nr:hypothetical protein [Candidatus Protochlamydia amoebophila]